MTSNSWNYRNFQSTEIFGRKFDFVLGEHKLTGGRSRNFSKNFANSWKWRQIPGIIEIFDRLKFLAENSTLYQENISWQEVAREIFPRISPILGNDVKFLELSKFLEMTSNSWNYRNFRSTEIFGRKFDFVSGEHKLTGGRSRIFPGILPILGNDVKFLELSKFLEMTSNSWNFRNFRSTEIFGRKFHFVSGEHKLTGSRSRNFSWNFASSWKWRQIPGITDRKEIFV